MHARQRILTMIAAAAAMSALAASPALAHGGSVSPADEQPCRNLNLNERGAAAHAQDGLSAAGEHGAAVAWAHCPQ